MLVAGCVSEEDPGTQDEDPEATIEGTWAGVMNHTYYCEAEPSTIQFDITGTTITITGGTTLANELTGTVTKQTDQSYTVTLIDDGDLYGQLFVDTAKNYALLVIYSSPSSDSGFVGVLQKGEITSTTFQESDLVGSWAGVAVRVNTNFEVTESSASSATITNPEGLELNGSDGDGSFSATAPGIVLESDEHETLGVYISGGGGANQVDWSGNLYDAIYVLSNDKTVLAVGFLEGACDTDIFSDVNIPNQKFAIWLKQ